MRHIRHTHPILMKLPRHFRPFPFLAISLIGLGLTGCIITNSSNTKITGKPIEDDVFAQVRADQTQDEVIKLLGQPSKKDTENEAGEIWKWTYSITKSSEHTFIVLFAGTDNTTTTQTTVV